jgi:hypothetical protein
MISSIGLLILISLVRYPAIATSCRTTVEADRTVGTTISDNANNTKAKMVHFMFSLPGYFFLGIPINWRVLGG